MGLTALASDGQSKIEVHQSATATFDEDGAEVVGVTSGIIEEVALMDVVIFDKPFYFFIKEKSTGTTLIAGKIIGF